MRSLRSSFVRVRKRQVEIVTSLEEGIDHPRGRSEVRSVVLVGWVHLPDDKQAHLEEKLKAFGFDGPVLFEQQDAVEVDRPVVRDPLQVLLLEVKELAPKEMDPGEHFSVG